MCTVGHCEIPVASTAQKRKLRRSQDTADSELEPEANQEVAAKTEPAALKHEETMQSEDLRRVSKVEDYSGDSLPVKRRNPNSPSKTEISEKRMRVFRKKAPLSYLEKLERATSQRMFVLDRTRSGNEPIPEETIDMAGKLPSTFPLDLVLSRAIGPV